MIRVPFSFSLTGGSTKYGTPFENADAAFTNALKNDILAAILAASKTPTDYGLTLPSGAHQIGKVVITSDVATEDVSVGIYNGSTAVAPLAYLVNGSGTIEFPEGLTVASGSKFFIQYLAGSGAAQIAGYVEWEKL